ncbi:hypothetical protein GCM10010104_03340 [Streptomyces indiaensis]|uniref:Uncharacterized protein n=1 Tax=Streptomyces indiaensis TaxID=284033 RepID=A0ABP6HCJ5_9ACTN
MASYEARVDSRNSGARTGRTLAGADVRQMNTPVFAAQGVVSVERMDGYRSSDVDVVEVTLRGVEARQTPKGGQVYPPHLIAMRQAVIFSSPIGLNFC